MFNLVFRKVIFLFLMVLFSGCSYMTNFYIINNSDQPIYVEYQYKELNTSYAFTHAPRIVALNNKSEIQEISHADNYQIDAATRTIRCTLEIGNALHIGRDLNYNLDNSDKALMLNKNLDYLSIHKGVEILVDKESDVIYLFKKINLHTVGIVIE